MKIFILIYKNNLKSTGNSAVPRNKNYIYYMASSMSGQDESNLAYV